tara:strand:+ start:341 stop:898 length:558 start_codon:yes stop_codon:yes gene_type:complete
MNRIEKNIKELLHELESGKRRNIKAHLMKQVKNNNDSDNQLILFNLLMDLHEENKKLKEQGAVSIISNILEEMKYAIETRDESKLTRFESYIDNQEKSIAIQEEELTEVKELMGDYQDVLGERVMSWDSVNYDKNYYETIYSRQSYLEFMERGEKVINKSCGVTTMRLNQMKQEILKNKSLNRFR